MFRIVLTNLSAVITSAIVFASKKDLREPVTPSSCSPPLPLFLSVQTADTPNNSSPRQKAENWELLWGKGGTQNRRKRQMGRHSPYSWGRKEWRHKQFLSLPKANSSSELIFALCSLQAGWCEGSANKRSHVYLCLCRNTHACVGSEDTQGQQSSQAHPTSELH